MNKIYLRLAKTNLVNNKRLYLPYILSGMMSAGMFYLMMFLNNNQGISQIPGSASLQSLMAIGVMVIGVFSYIFLFYTNSFIIKRRKKEIGVYNILGMEKRHITKVLGIETLTVAVLSIAGGLIFGLLFSKFALMLLYRILGFQESIVFSVTGAGIVMTLVVFGFLYFLTLLYNTMQIRLANPIELLHGGNVGEKEPKTKLLMTVAGLLCLGAAYYISFTTEKPMEVIALFFVAVTLVIVGTYCLFIAGSIAFLKLLRKNKKFYYNKKHFTAVSGMLYRMKQNAAGLASICILCTMVLVMVSTTVSMFSGVNDELVARYPMDISLYSEYDTADADSAKAVEDTAGLVKEQGRKIEKQTVYSSLGIWGHEAEGAYVPYEEKLYDGTATMLNVVTREDLFQLCPELQQDEIPEVTAGNVLILGNKIFPDKEITFAGETFSVAFTKKYIAEQDLYMVSVFDADYYIVADSTETVARLYNTLKEQNPEGACVYQTVAGFDIDGTKQEKMDCANAVGTEVTGRTYEHCSSIYLESRQANEAEFYSVYGGLFFLGLFLGAMFLMATVMIIFYKQISEGYDDRERYQIMEKVGMSNLEVKASIQSQIRMVFFLPILMASVHVAAAFPMIRRMLALLNLTNLKLFVFCLIMTILVFIVIYYIVFRLTSRAYYKIVGNQV